jgi:hypothetical protein
MNDLTEATVHDYASQIAASIIESARTSGDDPITWVTGNNYMPPLRSFALAERIWQDQADDGESWELLVELTEQFVSKASVALECPDYDNALYAVDLRRFEYAESESGETLQDDWQPITTGGQPSIDPV